MAVGAGLQVFSYLQKYPIENHQSICFGGCQFSQWKLNCTILRNNIMSVLKLLFIEIGFCHILSNSKSQSYLQAKQKEDIIYNFDLKLLRTIALLNKFLSSPSELRYFSTREVVMTQTSDQSLLLVSQASSHVHHPNTAYSLRNIHICFQIVCRVLLWLYKDDTVFIKKSNNIKDQFMVMLSLLNT